MIRLPLPLRLGLTACALLANSIAFAGRPLVVDDANVNEVGHGHLEAWVAREPGSTVYNIAPAYAPIEGLELGALLARDRSTSTTLSAVQAKWRITPSQENGCNVGAVLGVAHAQGASNTTYLNGLVTCNRPDLGSFHLNLGLAKERRVSAATTWGVAFEREVGPATAHIEWFGSEGAKPTAQVGLRGNVAKNIQLDGTIGRRDGATLYTIGTKFQF